MVVAIIVISALTSHGSGMSTTPSGSSSTAGSASSPTATPKVALVGSYFDVQDASGNTYLVTLAKVIDPAQGSDQLNTPDNGKRFVGVVFTVKALSGSPKMKTPTTTPQSSAATGRPTTPISTASPDTPTSATARST